jgi:lysophospholipase L1-like esterase
MALFAVLAFFVRAQSSSNSNQWTGSWAASQQIPEPQNALPIDDLRDVTMRQIFCLSISGQALRVRLSNAFGAKPLHFTSVHIARPISLSSAQINPGTDKALKFSGRDDVVVPAGAEYFSDPINYPVAALSSVDVTFHLDNPPAGETGHPGSRATSYYVHGDLVGATDLPGAKHVDHWYQISGIDVTSGPDARAVIVLGDSITDGHAATTNGNDRWTDVLAERLQASHATRDVAVLNEGTGGNHLLIDGLGPNALARLGRDVLAQTGVRYVIVLEGVNDLGDLTRLGDVSAQEHLSMVQRIISAYEQIVVRAHARGIKAIGATILPYGGSTYYHPGVDNEADRQAVNAWIRAPGHFDAVVDFDKLMRDPQRRDRLLPAYDSGDHLHPSPAGYRAMGEAVPLSLFVR